MKQIINKSKSAFDLIELELKAIKEADSKVDTVNKDLQTFKKDLPLLGCDMDRITTSVKRWGS